MASAFGKILAGLAIAGVFGLAGSSVAQQGSAEVDAEIVLAADVSKSMDFDEQQLQRAGYVAAFGQREVVAALTSGPRKRVAVTYMLWAGDGFVEQAVPWTLIDGEAAAAAFAEQVRKLPLRGEQSSSISKALTEAARLIDANAYASSRKIIMLSGDGANAIGPPVAPARDAVVKQGVTIAGLPIMLERPRQSYDIDQLDRYFEQCVAGGQGAFVEALKRADQTSAALLRAVRKDAGGSFPTSARGDTSFDCLAGEKAWARGRS